MSPLPSALVTVLSRGDFYPSLCLYLLPTLPEFCFFLHLVCPVIDSLAYSGALVKGQATSDASSLPCLAEMGRHKSRTA